MLGDSVYCDYDPELYSPDSYEHETGGLARFLHKYFSQSWESELKAMAFDFIRTHNRLMMWQTCKDVWALQQVENMGALGQTGYLSTNTPANMALRQYVHDNQIDH